ncbi:MAG TPA: hypothetical protein VFQ61_23250 [Polyangiaceae bacterium]|nr:hypothetical protein [Polyangiaceae bacterium]
MTSPHPTSAPVLPKRSFGIAGLAGFAACVACCALPMFAAAGVGGGLLSTVAGYIQPGADLVIGGLVGAGVLSFLTIRSRRLKREKSCGAACSTEGGCGCRR